MKEFALILLGMLIGVSLFVCATQLIGSSMVSQKEEQIERRKFSHPPMDLRLKHDRCDSCHRFDECGGVDRETCEVAKGD